jgi:DNA modification methylase
VSEKLKELADESVNLVITSPPYYCLRNYGVEKQMELEPTVEEYVQHIVEVFK